MHCSERSHLSIMQLPKYIGENLMWQSIYCHELHTAFPVKHKGKKKPNKHAKTGEEAALFWELLVSIPSCQETVWRRREQRLLIQHCHMLSSDRQDATGNGDACSPTRPHEIRLAFSLQKGFIKAVDLL